MKFLIWSRRNAENEGLVNLNCIVPHIWISIHQPELANAKLPPNQFRKAELFLAFDDCSGEMANVPMAGDQYDPRNWQPMSSNQAKQVVDFVNQYKDQVKLICVNCQAGQSRSAGLAEGLSLWLNGHDSGIGSSDIYTPNSHVKALILRETLYKQYDAS